MQQLRNRTFTTAGRALALLLALCLLTGMLPVPGTGPAGSGAAAADVPLLETQVVDFTACAAEGHETGIDHVTLEDHGWALNTEETGAYASIGLAEAGLVAKSSWWTDSANRFNLVLDFQVKASGYYDVDLLMAQRLESGWIQAFIDGVVLKGFGTLSTDAEPVLKAEPEKLGAVYLEAGVHTLKLELQQRYYVIPAKLTLTPCSQTIDFTACVAQGHETDIDHVTLEDHGWALNTDETGAYASIGLAEGGPGSQEQLVDGFGKPVQPGAGFPGKGIGVL